MIVERYAPERVSCVQYYITTTSCRIGVHAQPTIGGNPTTVTIATSLTAGASPATSTLVATAAISVEILDATLINPAGETWNIVWSDEIRSKVVNIANSYCAAAKLKRQEPPILPDAAPGAIDRLECVLRELEVPQQEDFATRVVHEVFADAVVEIPEAAIEAVVAAGGMGTAAVAQQAVGAGIGALLVAGIIASGTQAFGTNAGLQKGDVMAGVPKVSAPNNTPTPTTSSPESSSSSFSSSSSSSSSSGLCSSCNSCVPIAINDDRGQMGSRIPATFYGLPYPTATPSSTTKDPAITEGPDSNYSCTLQSDPSAPITLNRGPWCVCPGGGRFTSRGLPWSEDCYTKVPPLEARWRPRPYNVNSMSCDLANGDNYGMASSDISNQLSRACSVFSTKSFNVPAKNNDHGTRTDAAYTNGAIALSKLSQPTSTAVWVFDAGRNVAWPTEKSFRDRTRLALGIKYDVNACAKPDDPPRVNFGDTLWCMRALEPFYKDNTCPSTEHIDRTPYHDDWQYGKRLDFTGGKIYKDCISWEVFMVRQDGTRLHEIYGSRWYNGTGNRNSTGMNSTAGDFAAWKATLSHSTASNSAFSTATDWTYFGWNTTKSL